MFSSHVCVLFYTVLLGHGRWVNPEILLVHCLIKTKRFEKPQTTTTYNYIDNCILISRLQYRLLQTTMYY